MQALILKAFLSLKYIIDNRKTTFLRGQPFHFPDMLIHWVGLVGLVVGVVVLKLHCSRQCNRSMRHIHPEMKL